MGDGVAALVQQALQKVPSPALEARVAQVGRMEIEPDRGRAGERAGRGAGDGRREGAPSGAGGPEAEAREPPRAAW